jgi:hypothetical protein
MLDALRSDAPLIAGAYAASELGACPLLAAHRRGGREHGRSTFAGEWDRFTGTPQGRPRLITDHEREILESLVRESLAPGDALMLPAASLARAMRVPPAPPGRRSERDPGRDADRSAELGSVEGWAWLGVYRRLDDYEAALAWLDQREELNRCRAVGPTEEVPCRETKESRRCFVEG